MNSWDIWLSRMVLPLLLGKTTKTKALGGVRDVYVSIQGNFLLLDVYDSPQEMAQYTRELTVMLLLSIYADITISYKESIRILLLF